MVDAVDDIFESIANAGEFSAEVDGAELRKLMTNKSLLRALAYVLMEADAKATLLLAIDLDTEASLKDAKAIQMEAKSLTRSVEIIVGLATQDGEV